MLRYHHLLSSKPLPSGKPFELTPRDRVPYALTHESEPGSFWLTSDSVLPTFIRRTDTQWIIEKLPSENIAALNTITYTIGGMVLLPGNQIDGRWTINQARGCTGPTADRFDLTIECVRHRYEGTAHPLATTSDRYRAFFDLFNDFAGYVDFWLLDDLIDADGRVSLFLPSDDLTLPSVPRTVDDYLEFGENPITFVIARNERIRQLGL